MRENSIKTGFLNMLELKGTTTPLPCLANTASSQVLVADFANAVFQIFITLHNGHLNPIQVRYPKPLELFRVLGNNGKLASSQIFRLFKVARVGYLGL